MPKQPGVIARLKASSGLEGSRPSLYRWFLRHHDEFAAILERIDRPSWDVIAAELRAEGLTKKNGGPLTTAYCRQAWWKAAEAHKAKAKDKPQPVPSPRPGEIAHGVKPAPIPSVAAEVPAPSSEPVADAAALIAKLRLEMDKRSGR